MHSHVGFLLSERDGHRQAGPSARCDYLCRNFLWEKSGATQGQLVNFIIKTSGSRSLRAILLYMYLYPRYLLTGDGIVT